jgi:hypothetical protein
MQEGHLRATYIEAIYTSLVERSEVPVSRSLPRDESINVLKLTRLKKRAASNEWNQANGTETRARSFCSLRKAESGISWITCPKRFPCQFGVLFAPHNIYDNFITLLWSSVNLSSKYRDITEVTFIRTYWNISLLVQNSITRTMAQKYSTVVTLMSLFRNNYFSYECSYFLNFPEPRIWTPYQIIRHIRIR